MEGFIRIKNNIIAIAIINPETNNITTNITFAPDLGSLSNKNINIDIVNKIKLIHENVEIKLIIHLVFIQNI